MCVVIHVIAIRWHGELCFILPWHAVLCYVTSCYCVFEVVWVETLMDGSVPRVPVPYHVFWFANMSHVVIVCWTGLCKFTLQNVCVCGVMLHCNTGCYTNHYLNSKEVCGLAPCRLNMHSLRPCDPRYHILLYWWLQRMDFHYSWICQIILHHVISEEVSPCSMVLLYLATPSLGSLDCMVWL